MADTADEFSKEFGEKVASIREARAISQEELASREALHRTHISLIERGHRDARLTTVYKLAVALGVQPSELIPANSRHRILDGLRLPKRNSTRRSK